MSSFGRASNDLYRIATRQITPVGISKRLTCERCKKHQSIGQFSVNGTVCKTCEPKPAGWRRGDL